MKGEKTLRAQRTESFDLGKNSWAWGPRSGRNLPLRCLSPTHHLEITWKRKASFREGRAGSIFLWAKRNVFLFPGKRRWWQHTKSTCRPRPRWVMAVGSQQRHSQPCGPSRRQGHRGVSDLMLEKPFPGVWTCTGTGWCIYKDQRFPRIPPPREWETMQSSWTWAPKGSSPLTSLYKIQVWLNSSDLKITLLPPWKHAAFKW